MTHGAVLPSDHKRFGGGGFAPAHISAAVAFAVLAIGGRLALYQVDGAPLGPIAFTITAVVLLVGACAAGWRAFRDASGYREGWLALGLAFLGLATGAFYQLIMGLLGRLNTNAAVDLLLLATSLVPLIFVLASPDTHSRLVRFLDAMAALVLAGLFYLFIYEVLLPGDELDERGVTTLIWMFDIQNIFLTGFALLRFSASREADKRSFFGTLTIVAFTYGATAAIINRFIRGTPVGDPVDIVYDLPSLVVVILAMSFALPAISSARGKRFSRVVREIIPFVLPLSLFALSLAMTMHNTIAAVAGSVAAVVIYGARMVHVVLHSLDERDNLAKMSALDALTGLANRRRFDEVLTRVMSPGGRSDGGPEQRRGGGLALIMIDIDHFKLLNDRLGHQTGDERLRAVGQGLLPFAARAGDLVARYGGEEFAVILPAIPADAALAHAERICAGIGDLNLPSPAPLGRVTVSVGIAWTEDLGLANAGQLVRQADQALYASKHAGRNRATAFWNRDAEEAEASPN